MNRFTKVETLIGVHENDEAFTLEIEFQRGDCSDLHHLAQWRYAKLRLLGRQRLTAG